MKHGMPAESVAPGRRARQYIAFRVARQGFVMEASRVRSILPAHDLVRLGNSRSCVMAIAVIGGRDVPVVDLCRKFGIPNGVHHGHESYIVVVDTLIYGGGKPIGFTVDCLLDILTLCDRDFRHGSVLINGRTRRVLYPDQVFLPEDWRSISH